ncbi:C6 zinc finger domain-containing protein [Phlyctema vagabunda]|uniref:C6 zinc finger domain-containing protein n=1 Tax=Phlyctema vagabunda TaxID=108571 RepID=A0ABR4PH96_9HELO
MTTSFLADFVTYTISRGTAHLCRRADTVLTTAAERPPPSQSDPSVTLDRSPLAPGEHSEPSVSEKILSLVSTLADRVQDVEATLRRLDTYPRKRSAPDDSDFSAQASRSANPSDSTPPDPAFKPIKYARTGSLEKSTPENQRVEETSDHDSAGQAVSDPEAEDAATVLEFLAWGRLKDNTISSNFREPGNQEPTIFQEKNTVQTPQPWGKPSVVSSTKHAPLKSSDLVRIQELLPSRKHVTLLCEYHTNWLLFMHASYHATSFRRELDHFYSQGNGVISMTTTGLQWAAMLFAIICSSMTCAKPGHISTWGFQEDQQSSLAHGWYQASIDCLEAARFQQNHSIYAVQTISTMTICAHVLGYSNSQAVFLAAAVRIAQSLGLHRLPRHNKEALELDKNNYAETLQKEVGRRLWQQLSLQDWFSVPFSETYCISRHQYSFTAPLHCDEESLQPVPPSSSSLIAYSNFLFHVSNLMPELLDEAGKTHTINAKYEQVLKFDQRMRDLVTTRLPPCINSQMPMDSSWPTWVPLARRCLTITAAHKIIMIHRKFLSMSFHDQRFAFTRKTCLAAAKTIIYEVKQEMAEDGPIFWTMQAFTVAAAIILSLDNFYRHQSARESAENRHLVSVAISLLSENVGVSSISSRGTRLLTELLAEEQSFHARNAEQSQPHQFSKHGEIHGNNHCSTNPDKTLNVLAFVQKFRETDQPASGSSPVANPQVPLWLQDSGVHYPQTSQQVNNQGFCRPNANEYDYLSNQTRHVPVPNYTNSDLRHQFPVSGVRQFDSSGNPFGPNFTEAFDIRSVNWFDDLLGLAPSNPL